MEHGTIHTKPWWRVPLLLLLCLIGGSSPMWADTWHFAGNSEHAVVNHPTLSKPYMQFVGMFFDKTSGNNGYFTKTKPTSLASKIPSNAADGPAMFINGEYLCSPIDEFGWNGDGDGAWSACGNDTWWKNTYTRKINGITYTVKFYNPYHVGSTKRMMVNVLIFADKWVAGTQYKVTIAGMFKMNSSQKTPVEESYTWIFNPLPSLGVSSPTAEMVNYNTMKISGNLLSGYGPTTVGSYKGATTSGLSWSDNLTSKQTYNKGTSSFSNQEIAFSERSDYYNTASKYIEYIVAFNDYTPSGFNEMSPKVNMNYYQWYLSYVPGYIRAKANPTAVVNNKWSKEVKLTWSTEGNNTGGTWTIYRYKTAAGAGTRETIAENISYNTTNRTVSAPTYDEAYSYEIAFIPQGGVRRNELTRTAQLTVSRDWNVKIDSVQVYDESKIKVKWTHNAIEDASSSKPYQLVLQRKDNTSSWIDVKTINITSKNTTDGDFIDDSNLTANRTYTYRLKITVMDKEYTTDPKGTSLGGSKILSFSATRGSYSNMVKLQWRVKQVGTNITNFIIQRRPLGSSDDNAWADIHTTSGTAQGYSYDDVTALPGSFNQYKVVVWSQDGDVSTTSDEQTTDGFSLTTGMISGNITYGTGPAVDSVKVTLKQQTADGDITSGMRSVNLSGAGSGMKYSADNATLKSLLVNDFSIQMYVNPNNNVMNSNGTEYRLFDVEWALTINVKYDAANQRYQLNGYFGGEGFNSQNVFIPAGKWSHISLVYDHNAQTLTFYVTQAGKTLKEVVVTGRTTDWSKSDIADCFAIGNVGQFTSPTPFDGYIDEFRFFTRALTEGDILRNYNHPLAGNETGLAIYYPFDEGLAVQNLAYDFSRTNGVSNGRHATAKVSAASSTYIPSEDQMSLMAYTDVNGYYEVRGVPFSGEGTSYTVIPTLGIHEFSPTVRSRYVSMSTLNHSGVDFEDVSSFPVSGKVFYAGTDYPVKDVMFYVDGTPCSKDGEYIVTAEDGSYTISVPIGDHFIRAEKAGHVFAYGGRYPADPNGTGEKITFDREIKDHEFIDETLVNFSGRVVGGSIEGDKPIGFGQSHNNLGVVELVLMPQDPSPRMNVEKVEKEMSYSYETNDSIVDVASATPNINSHSWRGAGNDDCRKIFIRTDSLTGEFSAMVPPLQYEVVSMKIVASKSSVGNSVALDMSNPQTSLADTLHTDNGDLLYQYNTLLRQTYHADATFTVSQEGRTDGSFGIKSYSFTDELGPLTVDDIYSIAADGKPVYKYGAPLFIKEDNYTFLIEGYEEYVNADTGNKDHVPLAGSVVTVNNALSAEQGVYVESGTVDGQQVAAGQVADLKENQLQLDDDGRATYTWKAGLPNIAEPYTRTVTFTYDIDGRTYQWNDKGMAGIILGDLPTGSNFITAGPDELLMILRDPPGTNSFAEWTSGSSTTTSTVRGNTFTENFGVKAQHRFGLTTQGIVGTPGVGTVNVVESKDDLTIGAKMESEGENSQTKSTTTTTTRTISTSAAPEYVGAQGDVFIGTSTNVIFGKSRNVGFKRISSSAEVELGLEDIISTGMEFSTMFSYTQNYIENVLIPNMELMRRNMLITVKTQAEIDSYVNNSSNAVYLTLLSEDDENFGANGTYTVKLPKLEAPAQPYTNVLKDWERLLENGALVADSVKWVNCQIANWTGYLEQNEKEKVEAYKDREKYLVGDNLSFDSGSTVSSTTETESTTTSTWDWKVSAGLVVENSFGFEVNGFGVECTIEDETTGGRHETDEQGTSTVTSFSYTLAEEGDDDALSVDVLQYGKYSPIFHTRGGQTCCPYEGQTVTKYYEPGTIIMEATMQIEVPQIDVDVPVMTDVPTGGTANYTLRLSNASEIDEDVYYRLLVDDESNPNGANLMIDGKPVTDSRVIKIPAGQTVTKQLQLKQTDTSILDYDSIAVVLGSQCQIDPTSTWDVIADTVYLSAHFVPSSSPVDLALSNTLMNTQTGTNLEMTFSGFDRNYRGLKAFRLQYKRQGSVNWTQLHEYVTDSTAVTPNNSVLPKTGASVSYMLPMASFADGSYLFRVASVATYGKDEVYRYSQEIALTKDMARPRPLGQPEPADGVLDIGDELSVTFNEAFLKGALTKEQNFRVTGVLNGTTVDHETALSMQNTEMTAQTEASITLADKPFSFDAWVNLSGQGTILSHGVGSQKFTVGTDAMNHLVVTVADTTHTSTEVVPTGKWAFLTLSYLPTETGGDLSATVAADAKETALFSGESTKHYEGNGPLTVGKNMTGAIHELLLWDEAHDMSTALLNRSKTKKPSTRHLIGYWKMDEGESTTIRDYARNRHMTMPAETWYINNENKAVSLDGSSYMAITTAELPTFEGDDYALEFWVRGDKQSGEAQLVQAGNVALSTAADGTLLLTGKDAFKPAGQTVQLATTSGDVLDNAWHHIALNILRQGAAALYVDGQRVLTTNAANVGSIATDKLIVGAKRTTFSAEEAEYGYDHAFKGDIDELRIWSATMNADLLSQRRRIRLTGKEPGLVAYYPFEKKQLDSGNQVQTVGSNADLTGSGHTAELRSLNAQPLTLNYTDEAPSLRTKPTETNVSYSFTASDTKVVLTIDEDPAIIEGTTLHFTVRDVLDENGNYSEPVVWSAFINNRQLVWKDEELALEMPVGSTGTLNTSVVNKGGTLQMWTLSGMPAWLQASTESGTTNPLAETRLTFTVSEATPIGKYEETVYLTGTDGIETPLTIRVTVKGDEPLWAVDASAFENSMNLIGRLDILGKPSEDTDDLVAAFIDDECRGVAHPAYDADYDLYFVMMDIYGNTDENSDSGKEIVFKAYDASTGEIYPVVQVSQPVTYEPYSIVGDYDDALLLSATDVQEQVLALGKGWTWFSLYVEPADMAVPTILGPVADAVTIIKNQRNYMSYANGAWGGKKFTLGNQSMYQVKMSEGRTVSLTGAKVNPQEKPITLSTGWNWVAYNVAQTMSVADALADMEPQNGDYIKGQQKFATYKNGTWKGTLTALTPGQGYMIQTASARTFRYPKTAAVAAARMTAAERQDDHRYFTPVDYRSYADNMTVIARVLTGLLPASGVEVGVFAGQECRAAAVSDDEGLVFLTIPGDSRTQLTFRLSDGASEADSDVTLEYMSNATIGTLDEPLVLSATTTGISNLSADTPADRLYDLQGRRVYRQAEGVQRSTLKKGVYIENGVKRVK